MCPLLVTLILATSISLTMVKSTGTMSTLLSLSCNSCTRSTPRSCPSSGNKHGSTCSSLSEIGLLRLARTGGSRHSNHTSPLAPWPSPQLLLSHAQRPTTLLEELPHERIAQAPLSSRRSTNYRVILVSVIGIVVNKSTRELSLPALLLRDVSLRHALPMTPWLHSSLVLDSHQSRGPLPPLALLTLSTPSPSSSQRTHLMSFGSHSPKRWLASCTTAPHYTTRLPSKSHYLLRRIAPGQLR